MRMGTPGIEVAVTSIYLAGLLLAWQRFAGEACSGVTIGVLFGTASSTIAIQCSTSPVVPSRSGNCKDRGVTGGMPSVRRRPWHRRQAA